MHLCTTCAAQRSRALGHHPGRPRAISAERLQAIRQARAAGMPKARACRGFGVKRTTLYDALARDQATSTPV